MPELQALYKEMQGEGVNVAGIVFDGKANKRNAQLIIRALGIEYTNIVPDDKFMDDFVELTSLVPVSLFVNNDRTLLGNKVVGFHDKEELKAIIEEIRNDRKRNNIML